MSHVEYAMLLAAAWVSLLWTDLHFSIGVLRQRRRLALTLVVCLVACLIWDSVGVHRGYWSSNPQRVVGIWVLPGVPLEEPFLLALIVYASLVLWQMVQQAWAARTGAEDEGQDARVPR